MKKVALYNPYLSTKGGGEKVCLALAESLHKNLGCEVHLITHEPVDLTDLGHYFKIDLNNIKVDLINFNTLGVRVLRKLALPGKIRNIFFDRKVINALRKDDYDIFINNCYQSNLPSSSKSGVYMCMFPQRFNAHPSDLSLIKSLYIYTANSLSRLALHPGSKTPISTYKLIVSNSEYTRTYVKEYWNRESPILYPICENMFMPNIDKKKVILHVGRFFDNVGESHHKRQDMLLDTFAKMEDLIKEGWSLHFAGSVAEDVGGLKYILELMKKANGLPVYFHFNTSFAELKRLYNEATIYWHATGFGSNAKLHPEKQEHFGIATVEAMSAGCIPVVINSAGQKESVIHGKNGFLWSSEEELIEQTRLVSAMSKNDRQNLIEEATKDAERFGPKAFSKNVKEVFSNIVAS